MPKPPVPPEIDEFLAQPNPSVIATLEPNGSPNSVATWYLWENGRVLVNMDEGRKRLAWLRRDPRVSLTVLGKDDWYHHVSLRGRVVSLEEDTDRSDIDRIARHYTGEPYSDRERRRYSAWIEVERWHAWAVVQRWEPEE
jgi:PPOX class probable F420-dependent enzyme